MYFKDFSHLPEHVIIRIEWGLTPLPMGRPGSRLNSQTVLLPGFNSIGHWSLNHIEY